MVTEERGQSLSTGWTSLHYKSEPEISSEIKAHPGLNGRIEGVLLSSGRSSGSQLLQCIMVVCRLTDNSVNNESFVGSM